MVQEEHFCGVKKYQGLFGRSIWLETSKEILSRSFINDTNQIDDRNCIESHNLFHISNEFKMAVPTLLRQISNNN